MAAPCKQKPRSNADEYLPLKSALMRTAVLCISETETEKKTTFKGRLEKLSQLFSSLPNLWRYVYTGRLMMGSYVTSCPNLYFNRSFFNPFQYSAKCIWCL